MDESGIAMTWFLDHILGAAPGTANFLWGGFLSCLSEFAVIGGVYHLVKCHEKGCWKPGHMVNGTRVCHKHKAKVLQ